jgi:hypothetical protein
MDLCGAWETIKSMSVGEVSKLRAMFNKDVRNFSPEGDNHLSTMDSYYWSLCYQVLAKFGTPVLFKHWYGHAQHRVDARMVWFIPQGSKYEAVKQYLFYELRREMRDGREIKTELHTEYYPGLKIDFMPFSGVEPYLERDASEKMVRKLLANWNGKNIKALAAEFDHKHFQRGWIVGAVVSVTIMAALVWVRF